MPLSVCPPRQGPRVPFRSGIEGPPAAPDAPVGLGFAEAATRAATDRDVLLGYQIFLGRNPENSFVIATARTSRLCDVLTGMLGSTEFVEAVARPLAAGRALRHEGGGERPEPAQLAWLQEIVDLDPPRGAALGAATEWREVWRILADLRDFPRAAIAAPAASGGAEPESAVSEASFTLITIEQPKPGERLHPGAPLHGGGWAIAPSDVEAIEIWLGDRLLTHAKHGLPRPDVARNFPHYRHVDASGFAFAATVPADWQVDAGHLTVRLRTVAGEQAERRLALAAGPKSEEATPDWPIRLQVEHGELDRAGQVRLRGWAVSRADLASVQVFLRSRKLGEAEIGLARPDIARLHPSYPKAGHSGFVFSAALPGAPSGPVSLRVQAADSAGRTRQVVLPLMGADASAPDSELDVAGPRAEAAGMRLEIDRPALEDQSVAESIRGAFAVDGWAVAPDGIESIELFCDEISLGPAYIGTRREDVARLFPDHKDSLLAGWALVLAPGIVPEGERAIRVVARSRGGTVLERRFTVRVEAPDAAFPGSTIRSLMPRAELAFGLELLRRRGAREPFHVVLVTDQAPADAIGVTLRALGRQVHPAWTLLVDDPADAALQAALAEQPSLRPRLRTLADLSMADGDLVMRLRAGDELGCDALLEFAIAHALDPSLGLVYADEQRLDPASGKPAGFFKPNWSPELLLGMNYCGRAWSARAEIVARAGISSTQLASASDYALALRLTEVAGAVGHVPKILVANGVAGDTLEAERRALEDALRRRGILGEVRPLSQPQRWRVARRVDAPRISVIMPTCGAGDHVRRAIPSIRRTCEPYDLEIVVLDNAPASSRSLKSWLRREADMVVPVPEPFNWSRFNNLGAKAASGDLLLFLNDDVEAIEAGWLAALLEQGLRPEVGVVGAKLLYPGGRVQHAGQFLAEDHARHAFRFAGESDPGPFGLALAAREVSAVTGACMAMRREVFDRVGGFDESHGVVNNDLDFCLRVREAGWAVIYTPHAVLRHHELASRAGIEDQYDEARFHGRWRLRFLEGDPYHGSRLLPDNDHFSPDPEPVLPVHAGPEGPRASSIRRILAVKLDHIGDFLTALPALRSLKRRFPAAHLTLLAPPASAALARAEPAIDEIVEFTFFHARSGRGALGITEGDLEALGARLAPYRFDMAIDLRMQPETRGVLRHTGAPFLVGYDRGGQFPWLTVALEWEGDTRLAPKRQHVSEKLLQLVAAAEAACEELGALLPAPVADPASVPALAMLPDSFRARSLVCVHPGVGNPVRQWPAEHFAGLIDLLTARAGLNAILVGGSDEQAIAEEVLAHVTEKDRVVSLAGRTKLAELREVLRACVLFVGNNSGPKHLAASLGIPTLGIHSAVVDATEWGPLGPAAFAIRRQMVCAPCYLEFTSDCPRAMACLTGIRPREAYAACLRLLGMRAEPEAPKRPAKPARRRQSVT